MRTVLSLMGITIAIEKRDPSVRTPITLLPRCRNAFYLSGYTPSTTVALKLRFAQGMPVLMGHEVEIGQGCTVTHMPRAWHRECRLIVEQEADTVLSCNEIAPIDMVHTGRASSPGCRTSQSASSRRQASKTGPA